VVPLTTNSRQRPNLIQPLVPAGQGLERDSVILCNAPRAIVPSRFIQLVGSVPDEIFAKVINARAFVEGWDD